LWLPHAEPVGGAHKQHAQQNAAAINPEKLFEVCEVFHAKTEEQFPFQTVSKKPKNQFSAFSLNDILLRAYSPLRH
jgi:phenylalanyl-tRNA synthetase beta subunit